MPQGNLLTLPSARLLVRYVCVQAVLLHRSWFNTFTMDPLVVGLLAGQAAVLALWALLLWAVVLSRWVEMRAVSCHVSTLARWVVDVDACVVVVVVVQFSELRRAGRAAGGLPLPRPRAARHGQSGTYHSERWAME